MDKDFALTLAKLLVAVAWADGEVHDPEREVLERFLHRIPDLSRDDRAGIEVYLDAPTSSSECRVLIERLKSQLTSEEDKELAISEVRKLVQSNGQVDARERQLYTLIADEIQKASIGFERKLSDLFRGHDNKRIPSTTLRERKLDEFIENPIFYHALRALPANHVTLHMDKSELEKLCVGSALMASVAQADGVIDPREVVRIIALLKHYWTISEEAADLVSHIAVNQEVAGMDLLRMCRKFYEVTMFEERLDFFKALIGLVKSDFYVEAAERERLRSIAVNLKIPQDTMAALLPKTGEIPHEEGEDSMAPF